MSNTPEPRQSSSPTRDKNKNSPWSKEKTVLTKSSRSEVTVKLQQDDKTLEVWLLVSLRSLRKPAVWNHVKVNPDSSRLGYRIHSAAEFLACHQNLRLGDWHNPPACARAAKEALEEIQKVAMGARRRRGQLK